MERITEWILHKGQFEQFQLVDEAEVAVHERMHRPGKGQHGTHTG